MIRRSLPLLLLALLAGSSSQAAPPAGFPLCAVPGAQHDPLVACGPGGWTSPYAVWTDERDGHDQIYLTPLYHPGAGWPADGVRIAPSDSVQTSPCAGISLWDGSVLVLWSEDRGTGTGRDLFAQRYLWSAMRAPGWPEGGIAVCAAPGDQTAPAIAMGWYDDTTALVVWQDGRNGNADLYALRLLPTGQPASGWPAGSLEVTSDPRDDVAPQLFWTSRMDPVVLWTRAGTIVAQRVAPSGSVGGYSWPASGLVLSDTTCVASHPVMVPVDYADVATVVWEELHSGQTDLYGNQVTTAGAKVFPAAFVVSDLPGNNERNPRAFASGFWLGVVFEDDRWDEGDIYEQSGWVGSMFGGYSRDYGDSGFAVCRAPGTQDHLVAAPAVDWEGLEYIFWEDGRAGDDQPRIYGDIEGAVHPLPPNGFPLASGAGAQTSPSVVFVYSPIPEDPGCAYVVWSDYRNADTAPDIFWMGAPGHPVAVEAPAVHTVALSPPRPSPSVGPVRLTLSLPQDADVRLDVVDLLGRVVCPLARGRFAAGVHDLRWSGQDARGGSAAPGVYWVRGVAGGVPLSRKVVRLQ